MSALAQGFVILPPREEDVSAVAALEAQVFPDPWPAHLYLQEIGQVLRFQRVVFTEHGFLAGYLFACWQVDELHVLKVAVHPLHEGKGLATALMAEARAEAENAGARGLVLEVRPSNRRALRLYRHLGYEVIARRPRYYADGEDALVMTLQTGPSHDGQ
jgi:[ribosomal protein S18]-alanine N-acetyltransferase